MYWEISTPRGSHSPSQKKLLFFSFLFFLLHHFLSCPLQDTPKGTLSSHTFLSGPIMKFTPYCISLLGDMDSLTEQQCAVALQGKVPGLEPYGPGSNPYLTTCVILRKLPNSSRSWLSLLNYRNDNSILDIKLSREIWEEIYENRLEYVKCEIYTLLFLFVFGYKLKIRLLIPKTIGFPGGSVVKNLRANPEDMGSTPGLGRFPGEGNGNPL